MQSFNKIGKIYFGWNFRRNYKYVVAVAIMVLTAVLWFTSTNLNTNTKLFSLHQIDEAISIAIDNAIAATVQSSRPRSTQPFGNNNRKAASDSTLHDDQGLIGLESNEEVFKWIGDQFIIKYDQTLSIKSNKTCKDPPLVVLAINSAAKHFERRQGIRQTWGNPKYFNRRFNSDHIWKVIFIVGRTQNSKIDGLTDGEAKTHGDLLVINKKEHHKILTEKTLLGMYWASQICQSKFYFKGDDDVWVNKWKLFDLIVKLSAQISFNIDPASCWVGFVSTANHVPIRDNRSKYYVSYDDFSGDRFPPFCSGFAYMMSKETANRMILSIPHIKKIPGIDDVYIGLLANDSGIRPTHNGAFRIRTYDVTKLIYNGQTLYNTIAEHGVHNAKLMLQFQKMAKNKYLSFLKDD